MAQFGKTIATRKFTLSEATLADNFRVTAKRYPNLPGIYFLGTAITYKQFDQYVDSVAGWMTKHIGLKRGDRIAILMQNCPQWLIACYAAIRADLIVVPISPMNREDEIAHYLKDSNSKIIFCAQEIAEMVTKASKNTDVISIVVTNYATYLPENKKYELPEWLTAAAEDFSGCVKWHEVLSSGFTGEESKAAADDICALLYTSGSTGKPKACIHTHRSLVHNAMGLTFWHQVHPGDATFGVAPMYHVAGFCHVVTCPIYAGSSIVILPRWDRDLAAHLLSDYNVSHAAMAPTAVIDLLANPQLDKFDFSSLRRITSGGASMPEEVWNRLRDIMGISFLEAYGMTEAAATTHLNIPDDPRANCLGVPFFNTVSGVIDSTTGELLGDGETGEIIVRGPQIFQGYWNRPEATEEAFIELEGENYLRTGDIGHQLDGFFYITDRAKRMINASGLNVWPSEVENILYGNPHVLEVCVIGVKDAYRGETVKALIKLKDGSEGATNEKDIIDWSSQKMAAYKYPRIVEFVDSLPKSPLGKILWQELQDQENTRELNAG